MVFGAIKYATTQTNIKNGNITLESDTQIEDCIYGSNKTSPVDDIKVIDGDTFKGTVDLGYNIATLQTLRLRGIDAPDVASSEGEEAKTYLKERLMESEEAVLIRTHKSGKYDRYLVDLFVEGDYINQELIETGLAVRVKEHGAQGMEHRAQSEPKASTQ